MELIPSFSVAELLASKGENMPQMQIQVVDASNALFVVVEQTFDDRPEANSDDGRKWTNPAPTYSLTDTEGEFLAGVERQADGLFVNPATGDTYKPVGT
jgi:hypothetical protein